MASVEAARRKRRRTRSILTGIAAAAGGLGEFLVWGFIWCFILPVAGALVFLEVTEPDLLSFSPKFVFAVVGVIVVAVFVVLLTTTVGYLRGKRAAIEREIRNEKDSSTENPSR